MNGEILFQEHKDGVMSLAGHRVPLDLVPRARFFNEHAPLALPHHHPANLGAIDDLTFTCAACSSPIPPEQVRGVINDYARCVELRYVAICPDCPSGAPQIMHNVLRFTADGRISYLCDGQWVVNYPWWLRWRQWFGF